MRLLTPFTYLQVDFLRRQMEVLQRQREGEAGVRVEVSTIRSLLDRLDDRLTDALARLGLVENTTKTLEKRSAPTGYSENIDTVCMCE